MLHCSPCTASAESAAAAACPAAADTPHNQVLTLRNLREFDASGGSGPHANYTPRDPEVVDLLSRDPRGDDKHPFQAAMDDCLMITIKGIAAGMQNTG